MFQKSFAGSLYDDNCSCAINSSDSTYVFTGGIFSNFTTGYDAFLLKLDMTGNVVWKKVFDCGHSEFGYSVKQVSDGGYVISGGSGSLGNPSRGFVIKTNINGDTIWTNNFWSPPMSDIGINEMYETFDGGYAFFGWLEIIYPRQGYLIKMDSMGTILWSKLYSKFQGFSIIQTPDSGFILGGTFTDPNTNDRDLCIIKTNKDGDTLWTKSFGGSQSEIFYSLKSTHDGGYVIVGGTESYGFGSQDIYLLKMDSSSNIVWSKVYGGLNAEIGYSVSEVIDSGFIIAGYSNSLPISTNPKTIVIKTDANGNPEWCNNYSSGSSWEQLSSIIQTSDEGYIITGYNSSEDAYLIKTDKLGISGCQQNTFTFPSQTVQTNYILHSMDVSTIISSPYGDVVTIVNAGSLNTFCLSLGEKEELRYNDFMIYPNPTSSYFEISHADFNIDEINLYNFMGEKVYSVSGDFQPMIIKAPLQKGVYLVQIRNENLTIVKKLIVN